MMNNKIVECDDKLMVKVAIEKINYDADILYTYSVPENFENLVCVGKRVLVPFGKGNSKRKGIIVEITGENLKIRNIKSIITVLDEAPFINKKMLQLALWMKNSYFCSLYDAIKLIVPAGSKKSAEIFYIFDKNNELINKINLSEGQNKLIKKIIDSGGKLNKARLIDSDNEKEYNKYIDELLKLGIIHEEISSIKNVGERLFKIVNVNENLDLQKLKLTEKQKKVYEFVKNSQDTSIKEICYFLGVSTSVVDGLIKKNILISSEKKVYKSPLSKKYNNAVNVEFELSDEQKIVYNKLSKNVSSDDYTVSLLHGVTGSGKTAVFIKLIDYALNLGKNVIMMVPEISLTAQIVSLFKGRYGDDVSIIHSGLSDWERFDEWKKIKEGKSKIAVGTRSAVFAPFDEVGLIIIDEEHEYTYKSESLPRFHARDVAKYRCKQCGGTVLLSSATPSVESYYLADVGKYNLCELTHRYGNTTLPNVEVVDMNDEVSNGNISQFSRSMIEAVNENIKCGKQSILFLNRRGYHTFAKCKECGEVLNCPNCNVSLNYHSDNNRLMCHYCGYSKEFSKVCVSCGKEAVYYTGFGTQKAVEQLEKFVPEANVLRVDADTTQKKYSHEKLFSEFKQGKYNVMLGTQMISKGLNFPNVTLVGIILADRALYSDDFRSYEKAFSMMTQVIGRAGRGDFEGKAIIQTFTPENSIIELAARQDYVGFYRNEIQIRKLMLYPPFVDLCVVGFNGSNEAKTLDVAMKFFSEIKKLAASKYSQMPLRIFKPTQANINKVGGKYRVKILIKCKNNKIFRNMISDMLMINKTKIKNNSVNVFVDINPDTVL